MTPLQQGLMVLQIVVTLVALAALIFRAGAAISKLNALSEALDKLTEKVSAISHERLLQTEKAIATMTAEIEGLATRVEMLERRR